MKIRTITTGISLKSPNEEGKIKQIADFNQKAKTIFEEAGYEVQTTRIATNSWEEYLKDLSDEEILSAIQKIEQICKSLDISFFNIGYAVTPDKIKLIPEINKTTSQISCSAKIGDKESGINFENAKISAEVIKRISEETKNGYGNFRFCASANCKSGIPFFPTGFYEGEQPAFGIGLECGDLAVKAFSKSNNLIDAKDNLKSIFEEELQKVENIAKQISEKFNIKYNGIDASLNPGLNEDESIGFAYEKLGFGNFGSQGTLTISGLITSVLKNLSINLCGYSGLMLPVCEDLGLATRANEGTYNITNLLLYSAVCGCGLDVVPIPGNTSAEKIEATLLDVATLAIKLDKPLSARLLVVPGKKAGEMTSFNSPYLVDCKILAIN
ncbi:DUF711 family protein [Patescibacteria group bacterium]|nr:DUF711 family protein [Patescibacteria group bacterium]MBU1683802.1 DUF711 family protein [Patescibacteria group bacterium]MBU1934516.1 DUF711 family protein [Patescibacteria group bacterium]